jgi:hypothetical protein
MVDVGDDGEISDQGGFCHLRLIAFGFPPQKRRSPVPANRRSGEW